MYYVHCSPLSSRYGLLKWSDWIQELKQENSLQILTQSPLRAPL